MTGPSSHLPIREPSRHCNARRKQEEGYCQLPSGWGTDHPGLGRCKLHGGATPYRFRGRSKVYTIPLGELFASSNLRQAVGQLVGVEVNIGGAMAELFRAADSDNVDAVFKAIQRLRTSHDELEQLCERINELWEVIGRKGRLVPKRKD